MEARDIAADNKVRGMKRSSAKETIKGEGKEKCCPLLTLYIDCWTNHQVQTSGVGSGNINPRSSCRTQTIRMNHQLKIRRET